MRVKTFINIIISKVTQSSLKVVCQQISNVIHSIVLAKLGLRYPRSCDCASAQILASSG